MQPTDRTSSNFREVILSQFEPDIAAQLLEFGKLIASLKADYLIFMARKSLCLYDVLLRIGVPPSESQVLSDRILDMNLEQFVGKRVAVIDDTLIVGTTLAKTKRALLKAGAAEVKVHVFCVDQKWWCPDLIVPDTSMIHLSDDRVMTFCAAAVRAMSLIPRPYLVDFPISKPLKIKADEEQCFLSNLDWRGFNISTSLQERHDVSSLSFFPIGSTKEALSDNWGPGITPLLDIVKIRAFARRNRDAYWLQIVPIVVLKPINSSVLDNLFDHVVSRIATFTDLETASLLAATSTSRTKQRLLQYILSCIAGNAFIADSELSLSNQLILQFDLAEAERHYGPWLGQHLLKIGELRSLTHSPEQRSWKPAAIPTEVLQWAEQSLDTNVVQDQEKADDHNGSRSTLSAVRNLIPQFSDIFVRHYDTHELPTREAARRGELTTLDDTDSGSRDRLETGLPWSSIVGHLRRVAHLESLSESEEALSLVLDFCNDQGIAVPVTSVRNDVVFRAYRHGEDLKFTDAEPALAYHSLAGYLEAAGLREIPRLRLEKLLVILMKVGISRGFMEPLFLTANGVQEVLRIGFYLHGAIPMLQRGPKDRADRDMWFSEHLRHKRVIEQTEKGQYALGRPITGNFRVSSAPDDAFELGSIIGMLSKTSVNTSGPLDDRAFTLLASCGTPRHTAAAIQVELDIFHRWYEDVGRSVITDIDWSNAADLRERIKRLITGKGHYAVHEARLKFRGYHTDEPAQIIERCSAYLEAAGNKLAQRKWTSYWSACKVLEAVGEKQVFDKEIIASIRLSWEAVACLSAIEISFAAAIEQLDGKGERDITLGACQKLTHYCDGLTSLGLAPPKTIAPLIDRFREIESSPQQEWDAPTAVAYAQGILESRLNSFARQVEIMNPLIEEFGRLAGRRDYGYMVYYDIIDSTATRVSASSGDVVRHRARVRTLKSVLSRGFDKLAQSAQRRASEVFCWNGAETSTNDCKHVFIGGTDSLMLVNETLELLVSSLRAVPGQRVRIYVIPCGFAGSSAYRMHLETEISGERFWEHWSRLSKAAKALEDSIEEDASFLLVASKDVFEKITVPDAADWTNPIEKDIQSHIEGLVRETRVRYGGMRLR